MTTLEASSNWMNKWPLPPDNAMAAVFIDALDVWNKSTIPVMYVLLRVAAILPLLVCITQQSFSSLKSMKNTFSLTWRKILYRVRLRYKLSMNWKKMVIISQKKLPHETADSSVNKLAYFFCCFMNSIFSHFFKILPPQKNPRSELFHIWTKIFKKNLSCFQLKKVWGFL